MNNNSEKDKDLDDDSEEDYWSVGEDEIWWRKYIHTPCDSQRSTNDLQFGPTMMNLTYKKAISKKISDLHLIHYKMVNLITWVANNIGAS